MTDHPFNYDTAAFQDALSESGFSEQQARGLRKGIAIVLKDGFSRSEAEIMKSHFEVVVQKAVNEQTWKLLGGVSVIVAVAVAFIKLG